MRHLQFVRSNTFLWAFMVAGVFAAFILMLFGFIDWQIDGYLIARSDRVITAQLDGIATAHVLISDEREDRLFKFRENLLRILYNRMAGTFDELRQNQVSFVTFNYDRTVEHFFFSAIINSHGRPGKEVRALMEKHIPIVHLHGRLGYLPWQTDDTCVYRKLKHGRSGGEVRPGWCVN